MAQEIAITLADYQEVIEKLNYRLIELEVQVAALTRTILELHDGLPEGAELVQVIEREG